MTNQELVNELKGIDIIYGSADEGTMCTIQILNVSDCGEYIAVNRNDRGFMLTTKNILMHYIINTPENNHISDIVMKIYPEDFV